MAKQYPLSLFLFFCTVLLLTACSGQGATLDTQTTVGAESASEITDNLSIGTDGLPAIPDDMGEADKGSSDVGDMGTTVVLGSDYLQMNGGYVDGTSLVLAPEAPSDDSQGALPGYGLYKASGLVGKRPLSLNIECLPGGLDQPYFVGVADYTDRHWRWFGPINFPEFELDLRGIPNQLATHLGNMYFLIAVSPGNTATHYQSTVIWGEPQQGDLPGAPHHLVASDGQFPEAVKLSWVAGGGAAGYQVFRKPLRADTDWKKIGETNQTEYLDQPLPDYKMFCYRVRAVSPAGPSPFSNMDTGFASGGDDPCVIEGDITTINGEPLANIHVGIVGRGEEMVRLTNENGKFWFRDLAPGIYLVAPLHPGLEFFPPYQAVDLRNAVHAEVHFNAAPSSIFHRVFGFVVTPAPPDADTELMPVAGVEVRANLVGHPDDFISTTTDENGFYVLDGLAEGTNILRAVSDEYNFVPQFHEVVVNGTNPPDRRDFLALPKDAGGDPPPDGGDPGTA